MHIVQQEAPLAQSGDRAFHRLLAIGRIVRLGALVETHDHVRPEQPLEPLRTIHSFDPCIACAVHVTDPDGEELVKVKVR